MSAGIAVFVGLSTVLGTAAVTIALGASGIVAGSVVAYAARDNLRRRRMRATAGLGDRAL